MAGVDAHYWCAESTDDASHTEESAVATDAKSEVGGMVKSAERIGRGVDVERLFEIRAEALFDGEANVGSVRSESIDKARESIGVGVLMSATKKSYCNHSGRELDFESGNELVNALGNRVVGQRVETTVDGRDTVAVAFE